MRLLLRVQAILLIGAVVDCTPVGEVPAEPKNNAADWYKTDHDEEPVIIHLLTEGDAAAELHAGYEKDFHAEQAKVALSRHENVSIPTIDGTSGPYTRNFTRAQRNVSIPLSGLRSGDRIRVEGTPISDFHQRFAINLCAGFQVALHINPRFDTVPIGMESELVFVSSNVFGWHDYAKLPISHFSFGRRYVVEVEMVGEDINISFDGRNVLKVPSSLNMTRVDKLEIIQGTVVHAVDFHFADDTANDRNAGYENLSESATAADLIAGYEKDMLAEKTRISAIITLPENVSLPTIDGISGPHTRYFTTGQRYVRIPFSGLRSGDRIRIEGTPISAPDQKFTINLYTRESIALHIDTRFNATLKHAHKVVISTSSSYGHWQDYARLPNTYFAFGRRYSVEIERDNEDINISTDGRYVIQIPSKFNMMNVHTLEIRSGTFVHAVDFHFADGRKTL